MSPLPSTLEAPDGRRARVRADRISSDLMTKWEEARFVRRQLDPVMLDALQVRSGDYAESFRAELEKNTGGVASFVPLIDWKCVTSEAIAADALLQGDMPPLTLDPTPYPELPPDVLEGVAAKTQDRAREWVEMTQGQVTPTASVVAYLREVARADMLEEHQRMARVRAERNLPILKDAAFHGRMPQALSAVLPDWSTYPGFAIRIAPRRERRLHYAQGRDGRPRVVVREEHPYTYHRVNPTHIYPQPNISRLEDGHVFIWSPAHRQEVASWFGLPGVNKERLAQVLSMTAGGGAGFMVQDTGLSLIEERLERKGLGATLDEEFETVRFYGPVKVKDLREWGYERLHGRIKRHEEDVEQVQAWLVDGVVVRVEPVGDLLGRKPVFMGCYRQIPGALWGKGIPEIIAGLDDAFQVVVRAITNNVSLASGPQVMIDQSMLPRGAPIPKVAPWVRWIFNPQRIGGSGSNRAVDFFQPNMNAHELIVVANYFMEMGNRMLGSPGFMGGDKDLQGAGRTAGGLYQVHEDGNRMMRRPVGQIDTVMSDAADWHYTQLMVEGRIRPEDYGDLQVRVQGARRLAEMERNAHAANQLVQSISNEAMVSSLGPDTVRTLVYGAAKIVGMGDLEGRPIPSRADAALGWSPGSGPAQSIQAQQQAPSPDQGGGSASQPPPGGEQGAA